MAQGGRLRIAVDIVENPQDVLEPGRYVKLEVSDTGAGMPPEVAERVFEPFFTTKGPDGGSGLGLATCYGIVSRFGGTIKVRTELGSGSTFIVYLPEAKDVRPPRIVPAPADQAAPDHVRILLVEDEPSVREVAHRILVAEGFEVSVAADFPEAQELIKTKASDIDMLVSDVVLPHGNGYELSQIFAEIRPGVPTLLMSGYPLRDGRNVVPDDVFATILPKPFTREGLLTAVRERLDQHARLDQSGVHPVLSGPQRLIHGGRK